MSLTIYNFSRVVGGLFELPTDQARRVIPKGVEPIELRHGVSLLMPMAFEFTESMVGAYRELVLSIAVAPLVRAGEPMPRAAFFPFQVATTTRESREHAIERWHLPHWMEDVGIDFVSESGRHHVVASADGTKVVDLTVYDHAFEPVSHLYHMFTTDGSCNYLGRITMEAPFSDHEEGRGELRLAEHAFLRGLDPADVYEVPIREQSMQAGVQTFQPLERL
jgi:hypothetical protein